MLNNNFKATGNCNFNDYTWDKPDAPKIIPQLIANK